MTLGLSGALLAGAVAAAAAAVGAAAADGDAGCIGEFQLCASGECTLFDCDGPGPHCGQGEYRCPVSNHCVKGAEGYSGCPGLAGTHLDHTLDTETRVTKLMAQVNLTEQIGQVLTLLPLPPNPRPPAPSPHPFGLTLPRRGAAHQRGAGAGAPRHPRLQLAVRRRARRPRLGQHLLSRRPRPGREFRQGPALPGWRGGRAGSAGQAQLPDAHDGHARQRFQRRRHHRLRAQSEPRQRCPSPPQQLLSICLKGLTLLSAQTRAGAARWRCTQRIRGCHRR